MSITITFTGGSRQEVEGLIVGYANSVLPTPSQPSKVLEVSAKVMPESREPNEIRAPKVSDPIPVETVAEPATQPDEPTEIPYERISTAVLKLSVSKGKDAALNLIKSFGAERKASEIDPAKFGDVLATIDKLMGE